MLVRNQRRRPARWSFLRAVRPRCTRRRRTRQSPAIERSPLSAYRESLSSWFVGPGCRGGDTSSLLEDDLNPVRLDWQNENPCCRWHWGVGKFLLPLLLENKHEVVA